MKPIDREKQGRKAKLQQKHTKTTTNLDKLSAFPHKTKEVRDHITRITKYKKDLQDEIDAIVL